jgi:hypothetical protein
MYFFRVAAHAFVPAVHIAVHAAGAVAFAAVPWVPASHEPASFRQSYAYGNTYRKYEQAFATMRKMNKLCQKYLECGINLANTKQF